MKDMGVFIGDGYARQDDHCLNLSSALLIGSKGMFKKIKHYQYNLMK